MSNGNIAVGGSKEIEMEKKMLSKTSEWDRTRADRGYKTAETLAREDKNQINKVLQ